ncbi:hypothetical protein ETB97_002484 [Aspergillus alliaceus]|uniref:NmrA-like domain-containing protein n=1 Tax=Petromyces alliaceus TaxID=209559 RepID=A0A8H6A1E5_PETAA|nr:hypothetical protein ETB97_002484 [Aspergillus burnettii]
MAFNRIAIYGHRGWASSAIVEALSLSGAPITVLYRPGSDTSALPSHVTAVQVDVADQEALVNALQEIDIVISLVGHEGVLRQYQLVTAIAKTKVQLFVPSDLAARYDEQGMRIPVNQSKGLVETAARDAGIPTAVVLTGNFAEFALATPIIFTGDSATQPINLCTRAYVAAAYVSIFAFTPIDKLKNRTLALSELRPTGKDIAAALTEKFGSRTLSTSETTQSINEKIENAIASGSAFALAYYCRKIWGTGQQVAMVGQDMWDLKEYPKACLRDLLIDGNLQSYRDMPVEVVNLFRPQLELCK